MAPTQPQIEQVQANLVNMQKLNDFIYNEGNSRVLNAYLLLSEQDDDDPGLEIGLDIFEGVFSAMTGELGPVGEFLGVFVSGMVEMWATETPPNLNKTFASSLLRLQATSLAVDAQLATYHQDVPGNWDVQFTYNGQTQTLSDLANMTVPPESDPKFENLAKAAIFGLDQQVWTTVMRSNYVVTLWELSPGPLMWTTDGGENEPPVQQDEDFIAQNPAYYNTWTWHASSGCGDQSGWIIQQYNIGTGASFFHDGSMSDDGCGYLFIDSADGVVINADGLFSRETVFTSLGITQTTRVVATGGGGAVADRLSMTYLRAMKSGQTLGALIEREGRETVQQRVIEKAHADAVFATDLALRPRETISKFLGVEIPDLVSISAIVETPSTFAVVVPMKGE